MLAWAQRFCCRTGAAIMTSAMLLLLMFGANISQAKFLSSLITSLEIGNSGFNIFDGRIYITLMIIK